MSTVSVPLSTLNSNWSCPSCTTVNDLTNVNCSTCLEPKPGRRRLADQLKADQDRLISTGPIKKSFGQKFKAFITRKPADWTCPRCTQIMGGYYNQCTTCQFRIEDPEKSKEKYSKTTDYLDKNPPESEEKIENSEPTTASLQPKWVCKKCTYYNDDKFDQCEMCSTKKLNKLITLESLDDDTQPRPKRQSNETDVASDFEELELDSPVSKASRIVSDSGRETMSTNSSGRNTPYNVTSEDTGYECIIHRTSKALNAPAVHEHGNQLVVPTSQNRYISPDPQKDDHCNQAGSSVREPAHAFGTQKPSWFCSFCHTQNFKLLPSQKCLVCGIGKIPSHLLNGTVPAPNAVYGNEIEPVEDHCEPIQQQQISNQYYTDQSQPSSQHRDQAIDTYYPANGQNQYTDCPANGQNQYTDYPASSQNQCGTNGQHQHPNYPANGQNQYPDYPANGQNQYSDYPANGQNQYPDYPANGQNQNTDHPANGQNQYPDYPANQYPDHPANGHNQYTDHPANGQNQYTDYSSPNPTSQSYYDSAQQPTCHNQQQPAYHYPNPPVDDNSTYETYQPPQSRGYYNVEPPQQTQLPYQPVQEDYHYQQPLEEQPPQEHYGKHVNSYHPPTPSPPSQPSTEAAATTTSHSQFTLDLKPRGFTHNFFDQTPMTPNYSMSHHQRQHSDHGPRQLLEESMTQMVNCTKLIQIQQREDEREANILYGNIREYCRQNCEPFTDPDFPPADRSLYLDPKNPNFSSLGSPYSLSQSHGKIALWLRPREVFTSSSDGRTPWAVFRNPGPEDIVQGILGDCCMRQNHMTDTQTIGVQSYMLLGALSVIASQVDLLENILITMEYSPDEGAYQVRLCKDGKWVIVVIDDCLPCYHDYRLVFSKAHRKQLWVPLIEKAMAKLYGSYQALNNGTIISGLSVLTGLPCEKIHLKKQTSSDKDIDYELVWAQLASSRESNFPMGASCGHYVDDALTEADYDKMGLEFYHAYSVLDVRQVGDNRLIRLRNPWGKHSWNGAWSDQDAVWNEYPQLREELHPMGDQQGIFWISFKDFSNYFCEVDVCKYRPGWYSTRMEGTLYPYACSQYNLLAFEVTHTTEVDISIYQPSRRGANSSSPHQVDLAALVLQYPSLDSCDSIDSIPLPVSCSIESGSQIQSLMTCSGFLEPGRYAILPLAFNHWKPPSLAQVASSQTSHGSRKQLLGEEGSVPYMVALFSAREVLYRENAIARTGFLAESLYLLAVKTGTKSVYYHGMYIYEVYLKHSCRIVVAVNEASSHHFTVTCDAAESVNVVSTRGELFTRDCIPPKHWQIVQVVTQLELARYKLYMQIQFERSHKNQKGQWGAEHLPEILPAISELHSPRLIS